MNFPRIALAVAVLLSAGAAKAATVVYTSNTVDWTSTNYDDILNLQQFDPSLGNLTSIVVTLNGAVRGNVTMENLSTSSGATANIAVNGTLTLSRPGGGTIVITTPIANDSVELSEFDGELNFGGTSGRTYTFTGDVASVSSLPLLSSADFALFTGTGFVGADLNAIAQAIISTSNGNLLSGTAVDATAWATVEYTYDAVTPVNAVPEPATWALMVLGIGMVGISARRRSRAVSA